MLRRAFLALVSALVPAGFIRTAEATATDLPVGVEPKKKRVGYLWSEIPEQYRRDGIWFAKHKSDDDSKVQPVMLTESMPDEAACLWQIERCKRADLEFLMRVDALNYYGWNVSPKGFVKEPSSGWQDVSADSEQSHTGVVCYWSDEGPPVTKSFKYTVVYGLKSKWAEIHRVPADGPFHSVDETTGEYRCQTYEGAREIASAVLHFHIPKADPLEFMKLVDLAIEHGLQFDNQVFAEAVALRQAYLCKA